MVNRICGGSLRWRFFFDAGVSPVRVSTRIGRAISATGASKLRAISTASALSGEIYRVWTPVLGAAVRSIRLGRKPARVLPPPVGAMSSAEAPAAAASTIAN